MDIKDVSYSDLRQFIFDRRNEQGESTLTRWEKDEVIDRLMGFCWDIGTLWDIAKGTDPRKGRTSMYGTTNKRSMTYKLRKIAGYSYP